MLTADQLSREAAEAGFRPESFEKVARLFELMAGLRSHPFLRGRLALKGGTALNLFVLDVPRLSVDVDVNVVGAVSRGTMLAERPKVEQAVAAVGGRLGLQTRRVPTEHAGGKWRLSYSGASGRPGTLELDLNFLFRVPLWPVLPAASNAVGSLSLTGIPLVDKHELAAGKLAALFGRSASRDLFDVVQMLRSGLLETDLLRLAFVVYGGASRRDWRTVVVDDVTCAPVEVDRQLVPMLRADLAPARDELPAWSASLLAECRELLRRVLPLSSGELEFLTRLNEGGEIVPGLLTDEPRLAEAIAHHPALLWKAQNVRRHEAVPAAEREKLDEPQTLED
jgi:predicted nucleotidyltransferase component of viral defense system